MNKTCKWAVCLVGRIFLLCCAMSLSCDQTGVSDDKQSNKSRISEKDKAEVVRLMLERGLVDNEIPEPALRGINNQVILVTRNIKPEWVPKIPGVIFVLLHPNDVQKRADREGDFVYLFFSSLQVKDAKVMASLAWDCALSRHSRPVPAPFHVCGGGFTYEYRKESNKWVAEFKGAGIA